MNDKQLEENKEVVTAPTIVQPVAVITRNKSIDRLAAAIVFVALLTGLIIFHVKSHTQLGIFGDLLYLVALVASFSQAIFG